MEVIFQTVGFAIYAALVLVAVWGAFCVLMAWGRVAQLRFRTEEEQDEFLDSVDRQLAKRNFDAAHKICDEDDRAVSQLALLALVNRRLGFTKTRNLVGDRFQRDVLSDLEYRVSWVDTVIKSAPMIGLLGTVVGMMQAFEKLTGSKVDHNTLAEGIYLALITTACGLAIAIPLVICRANISVRIRKLEDLVASGMTRFFESFRVSLQESKETAGRE